MGGVAEDCQAVTRLLCEGGLYLPRPWLCLAAQGCAPAPSVNHVDTNSPLASDGEAQMGRQAAGHPASTVPASLGLVGGWQSPRQGEP